ncbi:hypothetical protein BLNAU_12618 [Blattamonas nauphoetae]|nr:hypothetical protein BLNAU_12605 [Blattamonas nauphoetae]KAK2952502.1 hypothetical protein BLNAU_12610 [Blattamonas nauphoetae]KAK2952506.1 hypothetical protein BLNAU_12614 [Blattamonas nauphoetae]KAK2952510.1 hypothetical protein BLNAU_12618 [Blattamonas nauphoetae]
MRGLPLVKWGLPLVKWGLRLTKMGVNAQIRTGIASDESEPEDDDQGRNEAEPFASEEKGEGKEEEKDDTEARQEEETTRDVEVR